MNALQNFFGHDYYLFLAFVTVLGLLTHFIKKSIELNIGFAHYWFSNRSSSALSIIGAMLGFIMLYQMGDVSPFAYFGIGYASDSILNKIENSATAVADTLNKPNGGSNAN